MAHATGVSIETCLCGYELLCCIGIFHEIINRQKFILLTKRTGSDGSMSASGSAGPGFDPGRGSKFSLENF